MGRWFKKTTVGKKPPIKPVTQTLKRRVKHPVITAAENDTGILRLATAVASGVAQFHLCLQRPGLFILEWGERTTQTLLGSGDQHHVAHKRLDGSEE